jgi:hypothetical protein
MRQRRLFPGSFWLPLSEQHLNNPPGRKRKNTMTPQELLKKHLNPPSRWVLTLVALGSFALCQEVQARDPNTPDPVGVGGSFNTADGTNALGNASTGALGNLAFGWFSLFSNTGGSFNTATGAGALLFNTGDSNTAVGAAALLNNATGTNNTAVGTAALSNNTVSQNTAIGAFALSSNTDGAD